jgi:hypothetical protein
VINKEIGLSCQPNNDNNVGHDIQALLSHAWGILHQRCIENDWKGTSLEKFQLSIADLFSTKPSLPLRWIYPPSHDQRLSLTSAD